MHPVTHPTQSRAQQRGVSLLESLVSLLVLALGVLGMLGIQLKSLTDNQSATNRILAARMADDLFERIKANPQGLNNNGLAAYDMQPSGSSWPNLSTPTPANNCMSSACTAQQQATYDLWRWQTGVVNSLPGGNGTTFTVAGTDTEQLGVMISWRLRDTDTAATTTQNSERDCWMRPDLDRDTCTAINGLPTCPANSLCLMAFGKP
jgi:type IV pilus assembly protein PilV